MQKQYWPAIILITIGSILLLHQMDLLDFSKADFISYGFLLIGIILLVNGLSRTNKKGLLGGVFFSSFGLSMVLMRERFFPRDDEFGFAAFFLALALANFVYMPFGKDKTNNLTWGIIFGVIGGFLLWTYFGYYPTWYIYDMIETYWPLILIVVGVSMIIKAYTKKRQAMHLENGIN